MNRTRTVSVGAALVLAGSLAAVAPSAAAEELAPLRGAATSTAIAGDYIVVLEDDLATSAAASATAQLTTAAEDAGAEVHVEYDTVLDGFAATLSDEALAELRADPRVAYVEADQTVTTTATQSPTPSWGLDRIDQRQRPLDSSYTFGTTGAGVTAYIVDTGIYSGHNDFGGRVTQGFDAIGDGRGTEDCQGHGTHVAGTVGGSAFGVAKDVELVPVRVLSCSGSGSNSGVIAGVDFVASDADGPAVANMSLGGGFNGALNSAVNNAVASGVTFVVAAGNDSFADACGSSPASAQNAITVASTTINDTASSFTNVGPCVDIAAPGSGITSAWINGPGSTNTISGTSMASPHVAGAAARYLQGAGGASPASVGAALESWATPGVISGLPSNTPNLLLHVPAGS